MSGSPSGTASRPSPAAAPPVLSSYRVPLGCPTQQEYIESVERRSATLRLLPESAAVEGSERVRVRIQSDTESAGWLGQLAIDGAQPLSREVRGERCQEVALALALITVLRLDRRETESTGASSRAAPGAPLSSAPSTNELASAVPQPAPAAPPVEAATATPLAPAPAAPQSRVPVAPVPAAPVPPAPVAPAATAPIAPEPASPPVALAPAEAAAVPELPALPDVVPLGDAAATRESSETSARELALPEPLLETVPTERGARAEEHAERNARADAQPDSEPAPDTTAEGSNPLALALTAHLGYAAVPSNAIEARLRAELDLGPAFHALSAALGVTYAASAERTEAADLGFRLLTAEIELCPASRLWAGIWLRACGQFSAGALRVSVSARDPALETEARTRPWFALGPSLHAGLPLAPHWSLRALATGSLLLVRDRLEVERTVGGEVGEPTVVDRSTLYRPPPLSLELLLGLGYAF